MSQVAPFEATTTPGDISAGLAPGCYLAQVPFGLVLYATAATAPRRGYFQAAERETFRFWAGPGTVPTWVRAASAVPGNDRIPIALARIATDGDD